jgi:hypothetical protein
MRIWSLHPRHLDRQGLIACWREALLAQAVLEGATRGYTRHPQLARFQSTAGAAASVEVTTGQLDLEWRHLGSKLAARSPERAQQWARIEVPDAHPLFVVVDGPVAEWERAEPLQS